MLILIWGITLLVFRAVHYGLLSGFLWWFDHWFLILSGIVFLKKSPKYQFALTYLILIIQTLWAIDNLYYLVMKSQGLGTTSFLFQPGISLFEFLLLQSHFLLPAILLYKLPTTENKSRVPLKILSFPVIIFILSYFSPPQNDINCIHSSCSPINIAIPHWLFSASFALIACALLYILSETIRHLFNSPFFIKNQKVFTKVVGVSGILLVSWNIQRHLVLPHFDCESSETEDAKISCLYTTDFSKDYFRLHYSIFIKAKKRKECIPYLTKNGFKEGMEKPILLPPGETHDFSVLVPTLRESTQGKLEIECRDFTY